MSLQCVCVLFHGLCTWETTDDMGAQRQCSRRKNNDTKWKTWKTTQEMLSFCIPFSPLSLSLCPSTFFWLFTFCIVLDENEKFCSVFFRLVVVHKYKYTYCLPCKFQLKFNIRISCYTVFRYLSLSFDRNIFLWHVCFCHCLYSLIGFLCECVRAWWCWWRWRRSDLFYFIYVFLFKIIYSFTVLFTVSIYMIRYKRKKLLSFFFCFFKQQNWISKMTWINKNWWEIIIWKMKKWKKKKNSLTHTHSQKSLWNVKNKETNIFSWMAEKRWKIYSIQLYYEIKIRTVTQITQIKNCESVSAQRTTMIFYYCLCFLLRFTPSLYSKRNKMKRNQFKDISTRHVTTICCGWFYGFL